MRARTLLREALRQQRPGGQGGRKQGAAVQRKMAAAEQMDRILDAAAHGVDISLVDPRKCARRDGGRGWGGVGVGSRQIIWYRA